MTFEEQLALYRARCEESLGGIVKQYFMPLSSVAKAAEYSLMSGGKRVRGVLAMAVCDLLEGDFRVADLFAAALEMIHAFSLIHDDLPCMDNDDMRRGKPSSHIIYGESTALLAGDMLSIAAFEVITCAPFPPEMLIKANKSLSGATGGRGMIYGQELDLKYEQEPADKTALHQIHQNKTGALIRASAELGIIAASKSVEKCKNIIRYADNIGLAFQIVDDILDQTSTDAVLGKPVGSDKEQGKTTFITLYGMKDAKEEAERLTAEAIAGIEQEYGENAWFLTAFAEKLAARVN